MLDQYLPAPEDILLTPDQFRQSMFTPYIPIEELHYDPKIIAFWRRQGFLPFIPKGKHAKVSFMQNIWLTVLDEARELGLPVKRLKDLTDYFLNRAYQDNLPKKNLEYHRDRLEKKAMLSPLPLEDLYTLSDIKYRLADDQLLYADNWDINYFSNLVIESLDNKEEAGILIYPTFICEYVGKGYRTFPKRNADWYDPHVHIPLRKIMNQYIKSDELNLFDRFLEFQIEEEKNILKAVRNRNIKSINILKSDDGERLRIDSTKTGKMTDEQAAEVRRILGIRNYESITLDTLDEKTITFKRTKKHIKGV